jgi:hypothetical protein
MMEMSALNHLMSTHVLQQAQQIQYLYDQVYDSSKLAFLYYQFICSTCCILFSICENKHIDCQNLPKMDNGHMKQDR